MQHPPWFARMAGSSDQQCPVRHRHRREEAVLLYQDVVGGAASADLAVCDRVAVATGAASEDRNHLFALPPPSAGENQPSWRVPLSGRSPMPYGRRVAWTACALHGSCWLTAWEGVQL